MELRHYSLSINIFSSAAAGIGGRTVRGALSVPEGRQFESPNRHVKIATAEVPLSKALNPYHELFYEIRRAWL